MVHQDVRRALEARRQALVEEIVARLYEQDPGSWQPFGSPGRDRCAQDVGYHLMYLGEAIGAASPSIFTDYIAWLRVLFSGLGFPDHTVPLALDCMGDVLRRALYPELSGITDEYLGLARSQLDQAPAVAPSFIQSGNPLADLANRYLEAMLQGDRQAAIQLIVEAAEEGVPIKNLYLNVFQPTQYEIGRLWQTNQISVAQEHFCTAATQLAMAQLYPRIFSGPKAGRRLVVTCVSGELHEIGARVLADLFEVEGWDTYYLGANTPREAVARTIVERQPDLLAVSATMAFHVGSVRDLVTGAREASGGRLAVMVGGYPFNVAPELWRRVGADGTARDAQEAIAIAEQLVNGGHPR